MERWTLTTGSLKQVSSHVEFFVQSAMRSVIPCIHETLLETELAHAGSRGKDMEVTRRTFLGGLAAAQLLHSTGRIAVAAPRLTIAPDDGRLLPSTNAWLEIDRQAYVRNLRTLRRFLDPHTKICAVLKVDAYGHGIELLMPAVIGKDAQ